MHPNKLRFIRILLASIVGLILLLYLFIQIPWVQNKLIQKATQTLSSSLNTEVKVGKVGFALFNRLDLQDVLIRDQQKDTLVYTHTLKLRISDIFFSTTTPIIKYIGLEGTKIHLHRNTEQWNYQFLLDFLNKGAQKKSKGYDLKKIEIAQIDFVQDDEWVGQSMHLKSANIIANFSQFNDSLIQIDQLVANKPLYTIQNKKGLRKNIPNKKKTIHPIDELYFGNPNTIILAKEIKITQGKLWIENDFAKPTPQFDGYHIRLNELNAQIENASFIKDTIKAKVVLSTKERSGFAIQQLKTQFRMTPQIMELNKLYLKTNKSILGPYYAMEYKDLVEDFSDYIHKVNMRAHLINAQVASDDIAFFAPELTNIHQKVSTSFKFNGTVADFKTEGLSAQYNNSFVKGNFSMKGIPEMRTTQINFSEVFAKTNYPDLLQWIPSLSLIKDLQVNQLGNLIFQGKFNGTLYDFVADANIQSALGNANTAIRIQFPINAEPIYEGKLTTSHFNIGKLLAIQELGWLNFNGKIAGTSFSLEKIKTNIEGSIDSLEYKKYVYTHINTNGVLQKKAFDGIFKIKDPHINLYSNVQIDFKNELPSYNAVGDLINANFKELNFTNNPIQLTGVIDVNFKGNNIDNFAGAAKLYNGQLKSTLSNINFDSLTLSSSIDRGNKIIRIASDDLQASIQGKFDIVHLPASVQYFIRNYLPTYIPAPKNTPTNQQLDFSIKSNYLEPYIRIFNPDFSGFNNVQLNGSLNTINKTIMAKGSIPFAQWKAYSIRKGFIDARGTKDSLFVHFNASSANLTDSFNFIQPNINIATSNDVSKIAFDASSKSALESINLNGAINTYADGLSIQWTPSYFVLNQKKWTIENGGQLSIRKNNTFAKNFKLTQGLQEIAVISGSNNNSLQLNIKQLILGDLTKVFFSYPSLEGLTNGSVQLNNVYDNFQLGSQLNIDQFSFNSELIGLTKANIGYVQQSGQVPFELSAPNIGYNLSAKGSYNIKDSLNPLDATLYLNHSNFGLVEQFIGGVLKQLKGRASGQIHFGGRIENPYLLGEATLDKASFIVDYTKVPYFIDSAKIVFNNEGIDFGNVQLKDRFNRPIQFKGKILEQGFKHLVYDMEMSSPKTELLNMEAIDNPYFYGKAVGKASMTIKGPEENIKMVINADVNDSSHIYLPNTTSKETGKSEFIVFKKYGKTAIKSADIPSFNLVVDLDVTANNKTQIDLIFDDLTGDVIKAVGNGRLKLRMGNIEPLTIRGKYNIESGKYDFNFQSFIKKPFELIPEAGNFIEWTGDPLNADIHVDARYTAERVSLNELVGSANFSNAVRTYRGNVFVIAALRNKLSSPSIKFSLAFPQGNPISSDNEFSQFISRLERDDNEILKQVSFLIVFNAFAPVSFSNNNTSNAYTATSIGINTISQLLAKEINKSITGFLAKVTGDKSLRFDVGSNVYNSGNLLDPTGGGIALNSNRIDRQRVNLKLGRSFLNDKIIVNIGGDLDFNIRNTSTIQNGNFQWLPDLNIEFILTRNRKLRAIVFNRNSLDINGSNMGRRNRQGISISYRKDFDDFIF